MTDRQGGDVEIELLPADKLPDEIASFDVLVDGQYKGHWSETAHGSAAVTWYPGEQIETKRCDGDPDRVVEVVRPLLSRERDA